MAVEFSGEVPQYTELLEDSRRHDAAAPTEQERERLAVAVRRHLADGRLDLEQFDVRVAQPYRGVNPPGGAGRTTAAERRSVGSDRTYDG